MWSYQHSGFTVHQLPVLRDNYIYLIEPDTSDTLIVVDPADAAAVRKACRQLGKALSHILNTHHHWDHTDGNLSLQQTYGCQVLGAAHDAARIPGLDVPLSEASVIQPGGLPLRVLDVPGHTSGHIAYLIADALFCGDTLFGAGCGRLFEGTPAQMWQSLSKLAALDSRTAVYCAHEYTLANLDFAAAIDPENTALARRIQLDQARRAEQQPTIPSSIGLETATNPFLRPLDRAFCRACSDARHIQADALAVFTDIRQQKDSW